MNPLQYESLYHKLAVSLDGLGTTTVDVHHYKNNGEAYVNNLLHGTTEAVKRKDLLNVQINAEVGALQRKAAAKPKPSEVMDMVTPFHELAEEHGSSRALEIRTVQMASASAHVWARRNAAAAVHLSNAEVLRKLPTLMVHVHTGKGSPEEIATALHLISRYKLYDPKFASDPAAGVRDYCDKYLGLDCNGFVGNYARAIGKNKVPNTLIQQYAPVEARRKRIEDVQANDVLVWTDFSHIAVIHSVETMTTGTDGKPARDCVVVESSGANLAQTTSTVNGGLQNSTYSLRAVGSNKVFYAERPKGRMRNAVYIAPLT